MYVTVLVNQVFLWLTFPEIFFWPPLQGLYVSIDLQWRRNMAPLGIYVRFLNDMCHLLLTWLKIHLASVQGFESNNTQSKIYDYCYMFHSWSEYWSLESRVKFYCNIFLCFLWFQLILFFLTYYKKFLNLLHYSGYQMRDLLFQFCKKNNTKIRWILLTSIL